MNHVAANREFTEILLIGDDKQKSKFLLNTRKSKYCETLNNLGTLIETMKNSWMFSQLMLSFVDLDGARMLINLSNKKLMKS